MKTKTSSIISRILRLLFPIFTWIFFYTAVEAAGDPGGVDMRFHLRYLDTLQDKSSAGVPIHLDAGCSKDEVGLIFNGMQDARRLLAGLYDWTQGKLKGPEYDVIIEKYLGTDKEVIKETILKVHKYLTEVADRNYPKTPILLFCHDDAKSSYASFAPGNRVPGLDPPEEVTKYIKRRGSACDKNGWAAYSLPWKYRVGQGKVETVEVVNGKRMEGRYKQDIMSSGYITVICRNTGMRRLVVKKTLEAFLNSAAPNFLGARPSFVDDYRKSMGWMILHELFHSPGELPARIEGVIDVETYSPQLCSYYAGRPDIDKRATIMMPDCYASAAMAIFIKEQLHLPYCPRPQNGPIGPEWTRMKDGGPENVMTAEQAKIYFQKSLESVKCDTIPPWTCGLM